MGGNGWISLHRKIQQHWLWENDKPFDKRSAWIDILLLANHQPNKVYFNNEILKVGVGEHITSEVKLAKRWGWSRTKVRNFLKLLKQDDMIEVHKKDKKRTRLKVLNYRDYQNSKNNKETTEKQQKNNKETRGKQEENINNNDNNENNDNNDNKNNNICNSLDRVRKDNGYYKYPEGYEEIYDIYPYSRGNKGKGWRKWKATRNRKVSQDKLLKATKNYAKYVEVEGKEEKYVKHIATFFGPDEHWRDYLEYEPKDQTQVEDDMEVVY